eukprot:g42193.t1
MTLHDIRGYVLCRHGWARIRPAITSHHHITSHCITSHRITGYVLCHHGWARIRPAITSHHITSHHTTSHHITGYVLCHHSWARIGPAITSHHVTSHHMTSHHITSQATCFFILAGLVSDLPSHHITSRHITSHHTTSHHITPHHITGYVLCRHGWARIRPDITSHHITPHHITSHHRLRAVSSWLGSYPTCHHIRSHHTTSHHTTSHHTTSHHITSHHRLRAVSSWLGSLRAVSSWLCSYPTCHHITSHHTTPHLITSHHRLRAVSSWLGSYRTCHHITSHHITSQATCCVIMAGLVSDLFNNLEFLFSVGNRFKRNVQLLVEWYVVLLCLILPLAVYGISCLANPTDLPFRKGLLTSFWCAIILGATYGTLAVYVEVDTVWSMLPAHEPWHRKLARLAAFRLKCMLNGIARSCCCCFRCRLRRPRMVPMCSPQGSTNSSNMRTELHRQLQAQANTRAKTYKRRGLVGLTSVLCPEGGEGGETRAISAAERLYEINSGVCAVLTVLVVVLTVVGFGYKIDIPPLNLALITLLILLCITGPMWRFFSKELAKRFGIFSPAQTDIQVPPEVGVMEADFQNRQESREGEGEGEGFQPPAEEKSTIVVWAFGVAALSLLVVIPLICFSAVGTTAFTGFYFFFASLFSLLRWLFNLHAQVEAYPIAKTGVESSQETLLAARTDSLLLDLEARKGSKASRTAYLALTRMSATTSQTIYFVLIMFFAGCFVLLLPFQLNILPFYLAFTRMSATISQTIYFVLIMFFAGCFVLLVVLGVNFELQDYYGMTLESPVNGSMITAPPFPNDLEGVLYPVCGRLVFNLSVVEYGFLSDTAYVYPSSAIQTQLDSYFGTNVSRMIDNQIDPYLPSGVQAILASERSLVIHTYQFDAIWSRPVYVVSVRGTTTPIDMLADARSWGEAVFMQLLRWLIPFGSLWNPALPDLAWYTSFFNMNSTVTPHYYDVVTLYVQTLQGVLSDTASIVLTGHSLGGGLSIIAGARRQLPVVAFSGPNALISQKIFGVSSSVLDTAILNFKPHTDPVPMVDDPGILTQSINCFAFGLACHSLTRTTCELQAHCGSNGRPAINCAGVDGGKSYPLYGPTGSSAAS